MIEKEHLLEWLPLLSGLVWKSLIIFALAAAALWGQRRASAALRHLVCLLTLAALLALPALALILPGWRLPAPMLNSSAAPTTIDGRGAGVPIPSRNLATLPSKGRGQAEVKPSLVLILPLEGGDRPGTNVNGPGIRTLRPFPWAVALSELWLFGLVLAGLRPLLGLWGIACLSRASAPMTDAAALALASECASALRLTTIPVMRQADVPVPMTWGWRRPAVLLPLDAQTWPEDRLRAVLLHELAHVRRRDWLFHRFADLVCALYWFHPLVWLTARRLRAESEIACDDLVLTSGLAAPDYARHLLDVARSLRPLCSVPETAIAMAQTSQIEGRLQMILDTTRSRRTLTRRTLLTVLGFSAVGLLSLAVIRPATKAQAAPITAFHAPQSVFATPAKEASPETPVSPAGNATVELAGVTDPDLPARPWWNSVGTPLSTPLFDTQAFMAGRGLLQKSTTLRNLVFAFRFPASAQGVTVRYEFPHSVAYSSDGGWPFKTEDQAHLTEAQFNAKTGGARAVAVVFPTSLTKTDVKVSVAEGPWKVAATCSTPANGGVGNGGVQQGGHKFVFSPAVLADNHTTLSIATDATDDVRVVAVNAQGQELLPEQIGDDSIGTLDQITARFALPLSQIKEMRVETRPFQWVKFKGISLPPAK